MKSRYKVSGKTVQVADKGLNCARNIYVAVKEADDRYIFSKSIHDRNLSGEEKEWGVLENDEMADKASNYTTYKKMTREELRDSAKYVKVINKDRNGKKINPVIKIDQEKLDDDLKYAGYNLMECAPGLYAKKRNNLWAFFYMLP